jgi:hypothetical protein
MLYNNYTAEQEKNVLLLLLYEKEAERIVKY